MVSPAGWVDRHWQGPALEPGTVFEGRYEILGRLGEGGFGVVYRARQLTLGRLVALKVLRAPEPGDAARARAARFLREAELCAQLYHPHVVQIVDFGRDAGGGLYGVFAFAPGENLADLLAREGALAPREARRLMLQVLDALACAHAAGVIHRDIKPANVMVTSTGARRNALVLDFGIGRLVGAGPGDGAARLTGSNDTLGTPGYGAPEQWRGVEASPATDLFSWGLMFLECLTGKPVYGGTAAETLYQLLGPEPVPVPDGLARHPLGDLLRRATRKDAVTRDVSARGLFDELEACELRGLSRDAVLGAPPAAGPGGVGHPSAEGRAALVDAPEAPGRLTGEQRQITALCCRLGAFAAGPGAAEAEELDDLLHAALSTCADIARRHRGRVSAALGAELLVYFGYPRAEEGDARQAARAALAIASALRAEGEALAARGALLELGVGLHTGFVVARDTRRMGEAGPVVGATPRLAARLASLASPGEVLASAESHKLLRDDFELEAEAGDGPAAAAPGGAFRLRREREGRAPGSTSDDAKAPLVGREHELDLLLERWRRARAGAGQSSLVTGEPGIGKSRLARELRDRIAKEAGAFAEGRCSPDAQNNALLPVIELLGRALGLDREPEPPARAAQLEARLAHYGFSLAEAMPLFLPLFSLPVAGPYAPPEASPQRQKELTINAVLSLLFAMAERSPLLLLVEDLHWADPTTLELLAQLAREAPSVPLYLVLTARPEFSPSFSTIGMLQLSLGRLERPQIGALMAGLLGHKALAPPALEQVASRTDGVPLFVEELTRMMLESGVLVERGGCYELDGPPDERAIPGTLRALLTARLDRLDRAKETAQLAAVLGREFGVEVLSAVSPLGPAAVQEDLDRLMGAGLVLRKRRPKDPVAAFKHALVRDAAYESLSRDARRALHARIAATLEARFPAVVEARPDLLARHHAAAEQHASAVTYGIQATRLAAERSLNDEAVAQGDATLKSVARLAPATRVDAELSVNGLMTPALMARHGWGDGRVKAQVERSRQLLNEVGESHHRFPTLCSLAFYHHVAGNRRDARAMARELLATAAAERDVGRQVVALTLLGQCRWIDGDYAEGERLLVSANELYSPQAHADHGLTLGLDTRVWATASLGQLRWFAGEPASARACIRQALAWAEGLKIVPTLGLAHFYDALVCQYAGDKPGAQAAAGRAIALAEQYGLPAIDGYCRFLQYWARDDAESAGPLLDVMRQMGCRLGLDYYASLGAQTLMSRGEFAAALPRLEACLAECAAMDQRYYEPALRLRVAACELHLGADRREAARASLREAAQMARRQGMHKTELDALTEEAHHFGPTAGSSARIAEIVRLRPQLGGGEPSAPGPPD